MPYKFKKLSNSREEYKTPPIYRPTHEENPEGLTGYVRGFPASDIEERFARALDRLGFEGKYWFQYRVKTNLSLPYYEKRLDFLIFATPRILPVEIYGFRWHSSDSDQDRDQARQIEINQVGEGYGWEPLQVIWERELITQGLADGAARRVIF